MISKEEVQHIAKLARLELTDAEVTNMQKDLSAILDYFTLLKKVKVPNRAAKKVFLPLEKVTRKDKAVDGNSSKAGDLINATPSKKEEYIKVKTIL